MAASDALLAFARDPRLAPHALTAAPVWLWSADATRVIWANAAGAQVLGAGDPATLAARAFEPRHPAASEVARLRPVLPTSGAAQLSRLRGFVAGRPLTCACSRFRTAEGDACILVVAQETVKPVPSPSARVLRMLHADPDTLVFAADGSLIHAGAAATECLAGRTTLEAIGAEGLGRSALADGRAEGASALGSLRLERLGAGDTAVLLAVVESTPAMVAAPASTTDGDDASDATGAIETDLAGEDDEDVTLSEASVAEPVHEAVAQPAPADIPMGDGTPSPVQPVEEHVTPAVVAEAQPAPDVGGDLQAEPNDAPMPPVAPAPAPLVDVNAEAAALDDMERRLVERRHPLRFVWTIDADGRFAIEAGDFTTLAGEPTARVLGCSWQEVAQALGLDREGRIQRAVASHDTWSGVTVDWLAEGGERLPVLLSGLPVLGRDREFSGYRGFGVCRDVTRIAAVIAARRTGADKADATKAEPLSDPMPASDAATETSAQASEPEDIGARTQPVDDAPQAEPAPTPPPRDMRAQLTVVPPAENVVPLRAGATFERRPTLNPVERNAFQEIARALGARTEAADPTDQESVRAPRSLAQASDAVEDAAASADDADDSPVDADEPPPVRAPIAFPPRAGQAAHVAALALPDPLLRMVLDRVPAAILAYRGTELILANRTLLEWTGYPSLDALAAAGGLDALFGDPVTVERPAPDGPARALCLRAADGGTLAVDGRLSAIAQGDTSALMLALTRAIPSDERQQEAALALQQAEANTRELESILDTATDGVVIVDGEGRVLSLNRSAEALFGYDSGELVHQSFLDLIAPESQRLAADYLEGLTRSGVASLLNDGREVIGRVRQGGLVPLFMTMGRIAEAPPRFCAVLRDITQWKRAEEELTSAKRLAEKASSAKSDFLAKISHEIRTPLNAIIGFSEVMMEERFGPIGNERYRGYVKDIHTSGEHMISLLNDLLDLSKIEAGKLDLSFAKVDLNDVMHQCVAIMQPQANRERIIIRTALSPTLPPVVADARSVRQIVLNLLSNAIKFTGAGGQVIVSTALTDEGEAVLRVRDTGIGMSEKDIATALEPFRQLPTAARLNAAGTGLGLPLTKALAEANRAAFQIKSVPNAGTLVEIVFPANRVLAE